METQEEINVRITNMAIVLDEAIDKTQAIKRELLGLRR